MHGLLWSAAGGLVGTGMMDVAGRIALQLKIRFISRWLTKKALTRGSVPKAFWLTATAPGRASTNASTWVNTPRTLPLSLL